MDFSLSEDQESVRDLARTLLSPAAPVAGAAGAAGVAGAGGAAAAGGPGRAGLDRDVWARLGAAGLLGIALPAADGGAGYGVTELALVAEEAGRAVARVPLEWCVAGVALPLASFGSPAQRAQYLPGVLSGTSVLTAAFTEPFADDPLTPTTVAEPDGGSAGMAQGGGWRLSGTKTAVPFVAESDVVLVPATAPNGQVVLALVRPDAAGLTVADEVTTSGQPAGSLSLDGVRVAAADVLAGGRDALRFARHRWVAALCATELGIAAEALRMAAAHTSTREQFGRPLATFQAVAVRLGNGFIDVQAMQSTLWQALWRLDAGLPADEQVVTAAFWAAEAGERVLTSAVHLHGGLGVDTDYPLHHWFLASKTVELSLGGASWQLDQLGRVLMAGPA